MVEDKRSLLDMGTGSARDVAQTLARRGGTTQRGGEGERGSAWCVVKRRDDGLERKHSKRVERAETCVQTYEAKNLSIRLFDLLDEAEGEAGALCRRKWKKIHVYIICHTHTQNSFLIPLFIFFLSIVHSSFLPWLPCFLFTFSWL